ncbi:MAG: hypothetical protein GX596_12685 [Propionibacterium sp.]|nr:hypothetical protein [Propionibacterium sp.]
MRGLFWFTAGAAAASYAIFRGKKLYRQYLPEAVRKEIAKRGDDAAVELGSFTATFRTAMAEREAELRHEFNIPEN